MRPRLPTASPLPRALGAALVCGLLVAGLGRPASATPERCQVRLATAGKLLFTSYFDAIARCEERKASGSLGASENCRPSAGKVTDDPTKALLARADDRAERSLARVCDGVNLALLPLAGPCAGTPTLAGLVQCLADQAHGADAEALVETLYGAGGPIASADLRSCRASTRRQVRRYATVRMTHRQRCARKINDGLAAPGSCPDAGMRRVFENARARFGSGVTSACASAALASPSPAFGEPCELFNLTAFVRDGATNNNLLPLNERLARCLAGVTANAADRGADDVFPLPDASPFSFGVAAGDATPFSFIAWARTDGPGAVTLEVATDPAFASIVFSASLTPDAAADNTVKRDVTPLAPATQYYYRFRQGSSTSRTGRVRTAPAPSADVPVTLAFSGDSNAFYKPFNVLEGMTGDDPDLWLYIGDTIYGDDSRSGTGVATTRSDYHTKYKENREDRALRDLMAAVGTVSIWDDHEVTNDFYGTNPDGGFQAQMADGNQAFRDYMPLREDTGDPTRLYRRFQWGRAAEFFLLDDRTFRDPQATVTEPACLSGGQPVLLPAGACVVEIADPSRTYLGAVQKAALKDFLLNSTATFKFVMNGPLFSTILFLPYDRWEGYAAERTEIRSFITTNGIKNVIFLSTDIHAAIENSSVDGTSIRELVAGAIGMDTIFRELPPAIVPLLASFPALFPTMSYFDIDRFTYAFAEVTTSAATFTFRDSTGALLRQVTIPAAP